MRLYYCVEAQGRRHHVRTALGVDVRVWNRLHRRVRDWRRRLEQRHGIPTDAELRPGELLAPSAPSCGCGCHAPTTSPQGADVMAQGLRVVEDTAVETRGVQIINVCLDMDDVPAYRRVSLDRLFNRVNATAAHDGDYALVIFGKEDEDMAVGAYERLRSYNPVPVRVDARGDGRHTRNLPIDRIIGGPVFRDPGADCLLQVSELAAYALLWREEPCTGADHSVFAVLDRSLNRRAARRDPRGVVRR